MPFLYVLILLFNLLWHPHQHSSALSRKERKNGILCDFVEREVDVPRNTLGLFEARTSLFEHGTELQAGTEGRFESSRGDCVHVTVMRDDVAAHLRLRKPECLGTVRRALEESEKIRRFVDGVRDVDHQVLAMDEVIAAQLVGIRVAEDEFVRDRKWFAVTLLIMVVPVGICRVMIQLDNGKIIANVFAEVKRFRGTALAFWRGCHVARKENVFLFAKGLLELCVPAHLMLA